MKQMFLNLFRFQKTLFGKTLRFHRVPFNVHCIQTDHYHELDIIICYSHNFSLFV